MISGWQLARLGDVCSFDKEQGIHAGLPYVGLENIESGTGRFLGDTNAVAVKSATFRFSPVHVLYGRLRPYLNKVLLPDFEGHCSTEIFPIRPGAQISREFLSHWLLMTSTVRSIDATSTGARMPRADMNAVLEFLIPVPTLNEQRRIVAILDEAFEGIAIAKANAEKNLRSARKVFENHVQCVFKEHGEGWSQMPLGEIGKVSMCKRIFKGETQPKGEIPFFKIGTFGKKADSFISRDVYEHYRHKYSFPNKGDVLISAAGTIGRRVIYDGEPAYFQDSNIVWIANDQTQILNHYLYHFYGACEWNSTKGATISRLYNDNLKRIVIAFPISLLEQHRIATHLDALFEETFRLTETYRKKLTLLGELAKSLLHSAFKGDL